jgi:MinD-like ATPase involved in chromosome partitioning or flagellar assembly
VGLSVRRQTPFVEAAPRSHASRAIYQLASDLVGDLPTARVAQFDFFQRVGKVLFHKGSDESRPTGTGPFF